VTTSIGRDVPRRDAADKLRGRTRYTVDAARPRLLHAAVLRSTLPSGRIVTLDVDAARQMPGVRAVVTGAHAPGRYGVGVADHPLFASEVVRHVGEPLAAVAAETRQLADAALAAVRVEIEPLPAAVTLAEALDPQAPLVHPDWAGYDVLVEGGVRGGNVAWEASVERGDVDSAFTRDDVVVVESAFTVGRQNQVSLEPRACVAAFEDGRYVLETSTQVPWSVRDSVATLLGVRPADVRVVVPPVGGGFGGKFEWGVEPFAALLARETGRPVKIVNSRETEMLTSLARENAEIRIRSAVTATGEIVGREAVVLMDCGAYSGETAFLTTMTAHTLGGNYRLGSVRMVSRAVYNNTPPTGAFRACNGVYNTFALEQHTDEICRRLGIDREVFRERNVLGDGDLGATGQIFEGEVLRPMLARAGDLRRAHPAPTPRPDDRRLRGRATVVGTWFVFVGPSAATVNVNADGSVTLVTAGVEIGSGATLQAIPQLVAERLGISPDDVVVRAADTDAAGYDVGVGGGRSTVALGAAGSAAADDAASTLRAVTAEMLEVAADDLEIVAGGVAVRGAPHTRVPLSDVVARAHATIGPVTGRGAFTGRGTPSAPGCAVGHMIDALDIPVFAVHDCDVAVDPDTGTVEVLAYRVVQDVGRAVNPRAIRHQIQGGVVQGLGYALHEEITLTPGGDIAQRGLESYRVPLAPDSPAVVSDLHEGAPSYGPLGVKGAGEVPILNVAAAVACAVSDAIGKAVPALPLTPPRVLRLMRA
jgi:CO/xanthine dehydrogenase Mo-binding subunit